MHSRFPTLAAAVALALGASAARADINEMFSVRGYGTVGGLYSTQDQADYVRDYYAQPKGAGRSHQVSSVVDSKSGVQLDARFTDRFSAVVQLVSEAMHNNSWDSSLNEMWKPSLEWANLSYRVTDDFTVRGGRIVLPFLMNSEFQKVGYANHWMRAPVELYGKVSYTSLDGADAWYKHSLGSGINTVRLYGGVYNPEIVISQSRDHIYGAIDTYEIGYLTLRAAYQYTKVESAGAEAAAPFKGLATVLGSLGAPGASDALAIANVMENGFFARWAAVGASYDRNDWFAMSEIWRQTGSVLIPEHTSGYVSGGVRIQKWTPYATFAKTDVKKFSDGISLAGVPPIPSLIAGVDAINNGLSGGAKATQSTFSVGTRWDVYPNIALKAQYDYVDLPSGSAGLFVNRTVDFKLGKDASLFGLSVDFVF